MASVLYTPELGLDLWYQALQQEFGMAFEIDPGDFDTIRFSLYQIRRDISDPRLEALTLHFSPDAKSVMIYKQDSVVLD